MYLSRLALTSDRPLKAFRADLDPDYALHQAVWGAFSDSADRDRDFIYRLDYESMDRPVVYALSERTPQQNGVWACETKNFQPQLSRGETLAFRLRANPVVSRQEAKGKRGRRHDVVMDLKRSGGESGEADGPKRMNRLIQKAGAAWLEKKGHRHGFSFDPNALRVESYSQHVLKRGQRQPVRFSSLDFAGRLTIEDPETFVGSVAAGIGPAKGFGMGLMLVRRV